MANLLPEINLEECNGCGDCVEACHAHAVELVKGKAAVTRPEGCDYCTDCESVCSVGAISCPFEIMLATSEPLADLMRF